MPCLEAAAPRVPLSLRVPAHMVESIEGYAATKSISKTDAFLHFLQKGMETELGASSEPLAGIYEELRDLRRLIEGRSASREAESRNVHAAVAAAAEEFPAIQKAYVFGSFARGDFIEGSDVDVRVEYDHDGTFTLRELAHFQKRIERETGREVDVVSAREIKNESLAAAIEREKVLVYEREK